MNALARGSWLVATLVCISMLAACNTLTSRTESAKEGAATPAATTAATPAVKPVQIADLPIPNDARIDDANSLVIGSGDRWLGRVVLRMRASSAEAYNHFFNGMPQQGWTAFSAVQSKVSLLTFTRGDRFATVQIEGGVAGATVTVLVTTRQIEGR